MRLIAGLCVRSQNREGVYLVEDKDGGVLGCVVGSWDICPNCAYKTPRFRAKGQVFSTLDDAVAVFKLPTKRC
jgi:hypothetical protein